LQAGCGLDYRLNEKFFVFANTSIQYSQVSEFKDEWVSEDRTPTETVKKSGKGHKFWIYDLSVGSAEYPWWSFGETAPVASNITNAKEGKIGGLGVGFRLGVGMKF
jgi:hypothetical protein